MRKSTVSVVITARLNSQRLFHKPLIKVNGETLVQQVVNQCLMLEGYQNLILTSESEEVLQSVNGQLTTVLTTTKPQSGSERLGEIAKIINSDFFLLVPCDIWPITTRTIEDFCETMLLNKSEFGTLVGELNDQNELFNPDIVKALITASDKALWFSRIPFLKDAIIKAELYKSVKKQIGLYWYSRDSLKKFSEWPMTAMEIAERNESLRILENGKDISCFVSKKSVESINTIEDIQKLIDNYGCTIALKD